MTFSVKFGILAFSHFSGNHAQKLTQTEFDQSNAWRGFQMQSITYKYAHSDKTSLCWFTVAIFEISLLCSLCYPSTHKV
jgi:hypothetical protein